MFNLDRYRSIKTRLDEESRSGKFEAIAHWNEGDKNFSTKNPIQFTVDYRMFFENNKDYKNDLAKLAWLYAFDIYSCNPEKEAEDKVFIKTTKSLNIDAKNDNTKLQKNFGMKDVENIVINKDNYFEDKDDITEIVIGHRKVSYKGKEKEIVLFVVRGTNGTHSEWSSNFDVGADTKEYYDATGEDVTEEKHPHWKNKYNHKGFDVTANRVIEKVDDYLSRHSLNSGSILITGHSRGAAVANLLAKSFVDKKKFNVYAYTFATPNNTTAKNVGNYNEIFNIVNNDDLIPYMPLTKWGFNKYGQIRKISVKDNYEDSSAFDNKKSSFEWLTGEDYNLDGGTTRTVNAFGKLANNREELYVMDSSNDGRAIENEYRSTNYKDAIASIKKCKEDLEAEKLLRFSKVEIEKDSGTLVSSYRAKVNYCPAYAMQTLANMASNVGPVTGRSLSGKYNSAKVSFIKSSGKLGIGGMTHPHMPITYYLIVNNDFRKI
ncbi:MAG: lipase family protein [Filifactoraceae bacterium]